MRVQFFHCYRGLPMKSRLPLAFRLFLLTGLLLIGGVLNARPIPEPLQPWVEWVSTDDCPLVSGGQKGEHCAWPGQLLIEHKAGEPGLLFHQGWEVFEPGWVRLPGDASRWPQAVRIDDAPASVIARGGKPYLWLEQGRHLVSGRLPGAEGKPIPISADTALVRFLRDGVEVPVYLDANGLLRFTPTQVAPAAATPAEKDTLSLKVFRLFRDDVPTEITTILRLEVSGKRREVDFGPVLLPRSVPLSITSRLSSSIDEQGRLRAIVEPGRWEIRVGAYFPEDLPRWQRGEAPSASWPRDEFWFFQRVPELYSTEVKGPAAVDPRRIDAPADWRALPAWRVGPVEGLTVKRLLRGSSTAGETRARIERDAWIGFDGRELVIRDRLRGTARPYSKLIVASDVVQPRAIYLDGEPQVLVRTDAGIGVSLRQRSLDAEVIAGVETSNGFVLPGNYFADLEAEAIDARLHLPPGWRLLATDAGIDAPSWLAQWTLYKVFLLLIVSIAFARVVGWGWGLFAALTLAMTFHEAQAPMLLWLALLGLIAVLRANLGNFPRLVWALKKLRLLVALSLGLMLLAYTVLHVRDAIHPQLDWSVEAPVQIGPPPVGVALEAMPAPERMSDGVMAPSGVMDKMLKSVPRKATGGAPSKPRYRIENELRATAGMPQWQGRVYPLTWMPGALQRDEPFVLWLMTPTMNLVFGFASSLMLWLLLFAALGIDWRQPWRRMKTASPAVAVALVGIVWSLPQPAGAADFPSAELLQQLADEVNKPPACLPDCASVERLHLSLDRQGRLLLRFRVHLVEPVAVPLLSLPRPGIEFRALLLDRQQPRPLALKRVGRQLLVTLPAGVHDLALQAAASADSVQLSLPLPVIDYGEEVTGWRGSHLRKPDGWYSLAFSRVAEAVETSQAPVESLPQSRIPPFFDVTRRLVLSDGFHLETTVRRLSPVGSVAEAVIPAWPREVIVTAPPQLRREGDRIRLTFDPRATVLHFRSSLQFTEDELKNYQGGVLREIPLPPAPPGQRHRWELSFASQWQLQVVGLPVIYQQGRGGENLQSLRPWPGESAVLKIARAEPVAAGTLALRRFRMALAPQQGAGGSVRIEADYEATRAQSLRFDSDDIEVRELIVNGNRINHDPAATLHIPLDAGSGSFVIDGELREGVGPVFREPEIFLKNADGEAVEIFNAETEIDLPRDRWVYHASGRGVGPDFLFWSVLPPLILVALALHAIKLGGLGVVGWVLVMVGFSQANSMGLYPGLGLSLVFIGWLYLLRQRAALDPFGMPAWRFDLYQIAIVVMTFLALSGLADSLYNGLLGEPKMQVAGNGSNAWFLRWFNDRGLPEASVHSLPMLYYRIAILIWAIWLSFVVLRWIKLAWQAFSDKTLFRPLTTNEKTGADNNGDEKRTSPLLWIALVAFAIFVIMWIL